MLLNMILQQINFFLESAVPISSIYEPNENQQQPPISQNVIGICLFQLWEYSG